jgi:two-component system NarL family response regulator
MATDKIRVLCVDDHRVVLDGLALLVGRESDMEVVAQATTGKEAIELFRQHRPDVVLMDLQLPDVTGVEAIRVIRREYPDARIVVLTMYQGEEDIHRALEAGAAAYLLKDTLSDALIRVVRDVHAGKNTLSDNVSTRLAHRAAQPVLTPRETEVVQLIAKGLRNKEIAVALNVTEETAKMHVKNILSKLNVNDRSAVVAVAVRRGILHIN